MVRSSKVPRAMMGSWTWTHTHSSIPWGSLCFPVMILQRVPLKTGSCVPTVWAKKYDHGAVLFMFLLSKSMGVRSHSYKLQAFNIPSPENHVSHNRFRGYHWNPHVLNLPSSNVKHNEGSFSPLINIQMLHVHHSIPSHPPSHLITKVRNIGEMHGERLIKLMGFLSLRCEDVVDETCRQPTADYIQESAGGLWMHMITL